jgi:hypothetical protein
MPQILRSGLFHPHSQFPPDLLAGGFRGLHVIRDPRDIAISAMRYHRDSAERWLHVPREEFGGQTYQQKLNSLSPDDQFAFELAHQTQATVRQLLAWRYGQQEYFEARYEDLMDDRSGLLFGRILRHLGFDTFAASLGMTVFVRKSIAGKAVPAMHPHIRSGEKAQWKKAYRRWHGERFVETLGDCLIVLGYEKDNSWVDRLPE